jgi:hypothetical protein
VSRHAHTRTIPARTSQSRIGIGLLLALANPELELCGSPSTSSPKHRFFAWRASEDDAGQRTVRFTQCLLLRPDWRETTAYGSTAVRLHRHPERRAVLHASVSVECHPPHIFPAFPRSLASVLIPRPAARHVSFSAFRKSFCDERRKEKDFPNLPKKSRLALGSGAHSRRRAQECPEGNPGKYKQGETQWHSTKTT